MSYRNSGFKTYQDAAAFLGSKDQRTIPGIRSTIVYRYDDEIRLRYHGTDVVTYHADGRITLNSGGYATSTTKQRFNSFAPVQVWQKDFKWFVSTSDGTVPFVDGMTI